MPLPQQIGPYKVESLLSKGGMSVLYLGIHPTTSKPIVIKVLSPKYCKNKEMASRFLKEAAIIGMAHHPNIVRLYGQGAWEKGLYIAMEFVQGISLRQFIQQKSLTHQRALEIILQVAYALCHLHTHGVIHRDLKPENILITESGEIKVIDFGIAHLQGEAGTERITQKRKVMGTPVYMSPEQKE
ncbi:MAG: serine/threonine protein kinase, partial [Verrucomicrobiota bacterium]|nr:serine/threonine protein kinase [Verrucomicrobiota bacterium]